MSPRRWLSLSLLPLLFLPVSGVARDGVFQVEFPTHVPQPAAPKLIMTVSYSFSVTHSRIVPPSRHPCGYVVDSIESRECDGLIDLFGGVENFRSVLEAERVEIIADSAAHFCDLRIAGESPGDPGPLKTLLLSDATYAWSADRWIDWEEAIFTSRFAFIQSGRPIVLEIAPDVGIARVLVDGREMRRVKLRISPAELELAVKLARPF